MIKNKLPNYTIADSKGIFLDSRNIIDDYIIANASNVNLLAEAPHRTAFFGVGICMKGSMILKADLFDLPIKENTLIALNSSTIRSWHERSSDNNMLTAFFNQDFINEQSNPILFLAQFTLFQPDTIPSIDLTLPEATAIKAILSDMLSVQLQKPRFIHDIMRNYIQILLHLSEEYFLRGADKKEKAVSTQSQITERFKKAVSLHFREKRKVQDYAGLIFVSAKHLSETIKQDTGKTVGEWIDQMVILEIKVLLKQTNFTVTQIVEQLNFHDTSSFAKFFKKATGVTPVQYRKQARS